MSDTFVPNKSLIEFTRRVASGAAEVTLVQLFDITGADSAMQVLEKVEHVKTVMGACGFLMAPDLSSGDFDTVRLVRFKDAVPISTGLVLKELTEGESGDREFKSSLAYDRKKAAHSKEASFQELKSDEVIFATLRTLCAFLNKAGGVLFIGINDDGTAAGIEDDCVCINRTKANEDGWELFLRDKVQSLFKEGKRINDYLSISYHEIDSKRVARIKVTARLALSFVRDSPKAEAFRLFTRQGKRTEEVRIDQIEEFLSTRLS